MGKNKGTRNLYKYLSHTAVNNSQANETGIKLTNWIMNTDLSSCEAKVIVVRADTSNKRAFKAR